MADEPPHISIAAGVIVGLVASLIQSLGLTIQRASHVSNDRLPLPERKRDWQRPLWLFGFAIFILSNVFGTLFQIGALPIVVLGPLGAVSLLWNAFFARVILGDEFSVHLVVGTILIAGGAVLIGIFGVVPEVTHTLPELVALYKRPAFVLWVAFLALSLAIVLAAAHLAEWRMQKRLERLPPGTPKTPKALAKIATGRKGMGNRRWSAPVAGEGENESTDSLEPQHEAVTGIKAVDPGVGAARDERAPLLPQHYEPSTRAKGKHAHFSFPSTSPNRKKSRPSSLNLSPIPSFESPAALLARFERTRLWLAIAYGATSGTLSGLCLLFTKTGIELLILTVTGRGNQFGHLFPWLIILTLLLTELFQLSYLNRALRLSGPTLVCPLAFCFYNTSSIVSGLIYYRQVDALPGWKMVLVAGGCGVLLAGVWVVSIQGEKCEGKEGEGDAVGMVDEPEEEEGLLSSREGDGVDSTDEEEEPAPYRPRGFSIGLGAASPGFDIYPRHHNHAPVSSHPLRRPRTSTLPSSASMPTFPRDRHPLGGPSSPPSQTTTALAPEPPNTPPRRRTHHRHDSLSHSLSGAPYVGSPTRGGHGRTLSGDLGMASPTRVEEGAAGTRGRAAAGRGGMEGLGFISVSVGDEEPLLPPATGARTTRGGWWKRLLPF
ncbi:hypothetical protein JCM11251_000539 [Rhodosporidiobolus azoricus]